jgi:octaprenyl-diphosphate synthase
MIGANNGASNDQLVAITAAIESTGGLEYTAQRAQQEVDAAIMALSELTDSPYKHALHQLADSVFARTY